MNASKHATLRTVLTICGCLMGCHALAQSGAGRIVGRLIDANGAIVTGLDSTVFALHAESGDEFIGQVSTDGSYEVAGLPTGSYDLRIPISCCMYQSYEQRAIAVTDSTGLSLDLFLSWGINLGTIGDDPGMLSNDMRARANDPSGATPRMPDGKPDLSGVWYNVPPTGPRPVPAQQPWAAEVLRELNALGIDQNAGAYCLPQSAIPTTLPFPYKFVQTDAVMIHLVEFMTPGYRQIFLDGRGHPELWNPAWMGHSVGTWDGDTLVVETVGFNEFTPGFGIHTENLRVIERIRRPDYGHLEIDIIAEDPEAYSAEFRLQLKAGLVPDEEILEFVCPENNQDPLHFGGLGWRGRP